MKRKFITPSGFDLLTKEEKAKICNGAGSSQYFDFVYDKMYNKNMNKAANRHDYGYHIGFTRTDKIIADALYYYNMLAMIWNDDDAWWITKVLRSRRCKTFAWFVNEFGDGSFFLKEKNNLHEQGKYCDDDRNWKIIKRFINSEVTKDNYIDKIKMMIFDEYKPITVNV